VRCIADIDLTTLAGHGHREVIEDGIAKGSSHSQDHQPGEEAEIDLLRKPGVMTNLFGLSACYLDCSAGGGAAG
jgi:hypothetical protein